MYVEHPDTDQPDLYVPELADVNEEDMRTLTLNWGEAALGELRAPDDTDEPKVFGFAGLTAARAGIKSSSRNGATVLWITFHTAEGARTAKSLGAFFAQPSVQASSHVGIDALEILHYVPRARAAWTLRNGNPLSLNAELCGFARWTRAQWLSTGTVDGCTNPRGMLDNAAKWARDECKRAGIDPQHLTLTQIKGRRTRGLIDHDDYSKATGDGTHWDCGPNFPWDYVLEKIQGEDEDDMTPQELLNTRIPLTTAQRKYLGGLKSISYRGALIYAAMGGWDNRNASDERKEILEELRQAEQREIDRLEADETTKG